MLLTLEGGKLEAAYSLNHEARRSVRRVHMAVVRLELTYAVSGSWTGEDGIAIFRVSG